MEKVVDSNKGAPAEEAKGSSFDVLERKILAEPLSAENTKEVDVEVGNTAEEDASRQKCAQPESEMAIKEVVADIHQSDFEPASVTFTSSTVKGDEESVSNENLENTTKKGAVVIESVIQLTPAIVVLKNVSAPGEAEANSDHSNNAVMDIMQTETGEHSNQGQFVATGSPNETYMTLRTLNQETLENTTKIETAETINAAVTVQDVVVIEVMDTTQTDGVYKSPNENYKDSQSTIKKILYKTPTSLASNGLGLLSQYGSDTDEGDSSESETASVVEVPTTANKIYRSRVVEIDSDSTETISSDSESETESEYLTKIAKVINKRIAANDNENDDEDEDDEDGNEEKGTEKRVRRQPPRVRGEVLLDDLPPIQDLQISVPAEECIEFGRVHSIVDQLLLVSALPKAILLDLDTVLFLEQGKRVLGEVFDVLGQVADPLYCVRFNTNEHIHKKGINIGDVVYVAPKTEYTQYIILSSIMKMRGSDASWENDIEPPPRYLDYSDDEEEREARQQLRKQRRQSIKEENEENGDDDDADDADTSSDPTKRTRMHAASVNLRETQPRRDRPSGSKRYEYTGSYQNRPERCGPHTQSPRSHQPRHNTSSWHSHYNTQYHPRPPAHSYRSPYSGPYPYQRPLYHTPSPAPPQFNPYVPPPMPASMTMPMPMTPPNTVHSMQPPPTQMTQPLSLHSMPPPPQLTPPCVNMFVPNPFAFRSPTLSQQSNMEQSPLRQPRSKIQSIAEPAPPGAD